MPDGTAAADAPAAIPGAGGARIGPNAVIQTVAALEARFGAAATRGLLADIGAVAWAEDEPEAMVDETRVAALHRAVRLTHPEAAETIARAAGAATAAYILANRIPRAARAILRALPPGPAARLLTEAIAAHAWTFAGSGRFEGRIAPGGARLAIHANPLVAGETADRPLCAWHEAVFTGLYGALVSGRTRTREVACCAMGAPACRFEVSWARPHRQGDHACVRASVARTGPGGPAS